ncbi:sensor histidine kinase [Sunxiuqinia elliptica]|uniref:histidine kinase n=1 Tax=Sunxiuqinia elliptica TaxID=655355 RepID=A0A1I2CCK5_9BACT|nr:HAMP domain-containing sensor histidine kinase [Sunxiuqinia elliptica]SFE66061.1 two-component system, OmpR family, phosphate regulon sensor histidine kinase PhoR [Sunxiuqinia elliptica]
MVRTLAKISLVLLVIVALPMSFYLVREFSALSKNEEMVERVFSTQLESILYSINQYSENVVQQWSLSVDQPVEPQSELMEGLVDNLFQYNAAVQAVRFIDLESKQQEAIYFNDSIFELSVWPDEEQVEQLQAYLESSYQQIRVDVWHESLLLYFLPRNGQGKQACQLVVEPSTFLMRNLSPIIQKVAQDLFYVSITDSISGQTIYTTGDEGDLSDSWSKASMWYLPGYELGIRLKSKTLEELASERSQRDNYLLMAIGLMVVIGFIFVLVNIRKEMKLAEIKSEFVSNVSHEIRTPLALISMYAETLLLKRVKTEEKQTEYLKTIQQESFRLTGIVNRILNFSRLEKNRIKYRFEKIDLREAIPEVVGTFRTHLDAAGVDCCCEENKEEAWVMADWESLKTMLNNLLDNAIKYSGSEKKIRVRLEHKPKQVWVEVEDNGIGIASKNQKYVFDQFYRVTDGDLAHQAKGSGLGLNLVKRMMKAHGGSVAVRSRLGEGSTFVLKFPRKK